MRKVLLVVLLAGLAGCNTVAGVGRDVTGAANGVQNMLGG